MLVLAILDVLAFAAITRMSYSRTARRLQGLDQPVRIIRVSRVLLVIAIFTSAGVIGHHDFLGTLVVLVALFVVNGPSRWAGQYLAQRRYGKPDTPTVTGVSGDAAPDGTKT